MLEYTVFTLLKHKGSFVFYFSIHMIHIDKSLYSLPAPFCKQSANVEIIWICFSQKMMIHDDT